MSPSVKHFEFVNEPVRDKPVSAVAGIAHKPCKIFVDLGYDGVNTGILSDVYSIRAIPHLQKGEVVHRMAIDYPFDLEDPLDLNTREAT
ncbi:unnamed protein product [Angiostrongylus costaricensis]|uniref:S1 motif domain-containing protein n=1 Tax=Angiostrongylus costaricensis TaxID=334426 RepID=A0A0R3Q0Y0_ANGCS|nr:unnamed protein product [Angiostrongylus costaricensis]